MKFKEHNKLIGKHAFLSPSNYHWVNYDDEKLVNTYRKWDAIQKGVKFHEFAKQAILLGIKMPRTKTTLNMYINDAIAMHMTPEQPLYYSDNAFGTADSILFDDTNLELHIHDLKTGTSRVTMTQLEVYAALFCLEYCISPYDLRRIELRIYQSSAIDIAEPTPDRIRYIMDKIIIFDKAIEQIKLEY